jgi:hypothetical protein
MFKKYIPFLLVALSLTFASSALAEKAPFGLNRLEVSATNENGTPDVQAGSHPYELRTSFVLSKPELIEKPGEDDFLAAGGGLKDVRFELPPGFVGDPDATPRCAYQAFRAKECPDDTAVGEATTTVAEPYTDDIVVVNGEPLDKTKWVTNAVYNVETPGGIAAEFGYIVKGAVPVFLDASVRTGGDYGVTVDARNVPQSLQVVASKVTIWGVPAAVSHNLIRGKCLDEGESEGHGEPGNGLEEINGEKSHDEEVSEGDCPAGVPAQPLLTNPTSCGEARIATMSVDSWEEPGNFSRERTKTAPLPALSGCGKLAFQPSLEVQPDGGAGSTPTGLNVHVHVPQESTTNPEGLGEADVKDTTVALPPGVQVSPSAADGLQACSNAQIGFTGVNPESGLDEFTPELPKPLEPGVNFCPDASKIANVRIATPLLEHELTGSVYLAAPQNFAGIPQNPFSSLIAMYLVAEEPEHGVLVKVAGRVSLNEATGQITTTFENTPELPYSDLQLEFYGTNRAPLATPAVCGVYTTTSAFTPWGGLTKNPSAEFAISSGPSGSSCTYPGQALPFTPSLASGTTNNNAGGFSNLTTTLSREDGQQQIQQVTLHYPPGVTGLLAGVPLCGEAQANAGTCGPESQIGESIVSVGLGGDPFTVVGGHAYITGPYEGAPFGLSIVNPAAAGPFVLQHGAPVVVRAKIEVNPYTAALTVTTNTAAEGYAIPSMIEGIPLQIKHVNVLVNRANFTINPTSCNAMSVESTIASAEGASVPVSTPFQVANCANLKFEPKFTVSVTGKNSKADGSALTTAVSEPGTPQGTQADIHLVKVELPKQLPSRLTTLQRACTQKKFEENPAGCPPESMIGMAVVHTPLLPVPLMGPAIFVSHGGEAFPSLTLVLQGDNVTVDLVGTTYISPKSITSTTFKALPDSPFSSFELVLPQKEFSALGTNVPEKDHYSLCGQKLSMPNEFVAQNGAVIKQSTTIAITGCKPEIRVLSHKVKGKTATIVVSVPAAGKLVVSGKGLSNASKTANGATTLTVKLTLTKAETSRLAKHRGRKLAAHIKLSFTPKKGSKLATTTTVLIR